MNRLHRFGTALFHVGGIGAGFSFSAFLYTFAVPDLFGWSSVALVVCGVVAGIGYVIQQTFNAPPSAVHRGTDDPERPQT